MMRWFVIEDEDCWQLFREEIAPLLPTHPQQIIKAPKHDTPFAEYWPNAEESEFIVDALNALEATRRR